MSQDVYADHRKEEHREWCEKKHREWCENIDGGYKPWELGIDPDSDDPVRKAQRKKAWLQMVFSKERADPDHKPWEFGIEDVDVFEIDESPKSQALDLDVVELDEFPSETPEDIDESALEHMVSLMSQKELKEFLKKRGIPNDNAKKENKKAVLRSLKYLHDRGIIKLPAAWDAPPVDPSALPKLKVTKAGIEFRLGDREMIIPPVVEIMRRGRRMEL